MSFPVEFKQKDQQWAIQLPCRDLASWQYLLPHVLRGDTSVALFPTRGAARRTLKGMGWVLRPYPKVIGVRTIYEATGSRG